MDVHIMTYKITEILLTAIVSRISVFSGRSRSFYIRDDASPESIGKDRQAF